MQSLLLSLSVFATLVLSAFGQGLTACPIELDPCRNGAVCVGDGVLGDYTCRCLYGWAGKNCDVNTFQNCGYNLYENTGQLISPNYPNGYGSNQNCHYYVRVHGAKQLTFTVEGFDTEFDKDALQYAPGLLWNFTGNYTVLEGNLTTVPRQFTIQGGDAWFVFESDRNVERPGFYITYQTTESSNCASNLCQNGAICTDLLNDYMCTCPVGFEGRNCEINVDNCAGVLCTGGKICVDGIDTYTCRCPLGYTGFNCKTSCISNCKRLLRPKCGSDGQTYRNRCYLLNAKCLDPSISMVSRGACTNTGPVAIIGYKKRTCIQAQGGSSSMETKFVKCPATQAPSTLPPNPNVETTKAAATTVAIPSPTPCVDNCPLIFEPVCGSDGVTYPNLCKLEVVRCKSDPTLVAVSDGECVVMTTACRGDCPGR